MRVYCLFATVAFVTILCVCGASVRDDGTSTYMNVRDNTCGPSLTWSLSGGTLTITGTGEMNNYTSSSPVPWNKQRDDITTIVINDGVTSIGDYAFINCKQMQTVTIPSTITSIGIASFKFCFELSTVTIPAAVTSIGEDAFLGCKRLTSINVEQGNTMYVSVDGVLFNHNKTTLIHYPAGRTAPTYDVPAGVTLIERAAFYNGVLTSITIPASVESIGELALYKCSSLTSISVDKNNVNFKSIDGVLFSHDLSVLIKYPIALTNTAYTIPDCVKVIGRDAFESARLVHLTIPDSVQSIEAESFSGLTALESVTIPNSVKSIGAYAFCRCPQLSSVTISGPFNSTGNGVFQSCTSLTEVIISEGVTSIGNYFFQDCTELKVVTIPSSVESIGSHAFCGCTQLENVVIPASVNSIGNNAFQSCTSLTKVDIPHGVKSIGDYSFEDCNKLKSITIPGNIESIGKYAFSSCTSLTDIIISDGVKSIGDYSFKSCNISSLFLPDSVTSIGYSAFSGCSNLVSVFYQGSSVITSDAFTSCDSLNIVCVSLDYKSSSFCKKAVTSSDPLCQDFRGLFSHCFVAAYVDGGFIQQQRKNVSIWENQTNLCTVYYCDNVTGPQSSALVTCDNAPPCYKIQGHCNVNNGECEYDRVDEWNELMEQENHCYGLVCEENTTKMKERDNATAWNKHSNNCYVYECENESGLRIAGSCSELGLICVNEECLEKTEMNEERWIVEIELDGVPAIDLEISEVEKNVMNTSGLNKGEFKIEYEVDDDGYVIRISIYVRDEKTANDIASVINEIEKGSCN